MTTMSTSPSFIWGLRMLRKKYYISKIHVKNKELIRRSCNFNCWNILQ